MASRKLGWTPLEQDAPAGAILSIPGVLLDKGRFGRQSGAMRRALKPAYTVVQRISCTFREGIRYEYG